METTGFNEYFVCNISTNGFPKRNTGVLRVTEIRLIPVSNVLMKD